MLDFGDEFRLTLLTSDPALAGRADEAGVERVGVDLERLGKAERQASQDTRLSEHSFDDLAAVGRVLKHAALFVRINPIHSDSEREIAQALDCGARVIMLPYFRTAEEVEYFVRRVGARAETVILLETGPAVLRIREILAVRGIGEVMFGLNDLRLQFGVSSHFEVLTSPLISLLGAEVCAVGLPLSIGGVARQRTCPSVAAVGAASAKQD